MIKYTESQLNYFLGKNVINKSEYFFYVNLIGKQQLTNNQKESIEKLNKKISFFGKYGDDKNGFENTIIDTAKNYVDNPKQLDFILSIETFYQEHNYLSLKQMEALDNIVGVKMYTTCIDSILNNLNIGE